MQECRGTLPRDGHDGGAPGRGQATTVRAHTYALLARLFSAPPDRDLLERACRHRRRRRRPKPTSRRLAAGHGGRPRRAALDDEYHDLFIGLGRGEVVPYGSWYLTGFMMDQPLAVLRADLAALGFERQDEVREPEDHVAALCEVMAMLITGGEPLDVQRSFYQRHLDAWIEHVLPRPAEGQDGALLPRRRHLGRGILRYRKEVPDACDVTTGDRCPEGGHRSNER